MKNSISALDHIIFQFAERYRNYIFFLLISVISFMIRFLFIGYESLDYQWSLLSWSQYLETNGGFRAIASAQTDYNVSYLYFLAAFTYLPLSYLVKIKLLSIVFDFFIASVIGIMVRLLRKGNDEVVPLAFYGLTLFIPTLILNGSVWGQCDAIYASFSLVSIYFIIREKYNLSILFFSFAFAFKLQAIFILPIFVYVYFKTKKFSLIKILILPSVLFIIYLPSVFMGKPISQFLLSYFTQISEYKKTTLNFANIYMLIPSDYNFFALSGILFTIGIILTILFIVLFSDHYQATPKRIIDLALIFVLISTLTLPSMHERYAFMADILAILYFYLHKKRFLIAISIWFINYESYLPFLFETDTHLPFEYLSIIYFLTVVFVVVYFYFDRNDCENVLIGGLNEK